MNEVEAQAERLAWSVDESDYDSEASLSGSDGSEGEVPVVTGEADTSSKLLASAGKPHSNNLLAGYPPKHSTIANPGLKEGGGGGAFIRGWKPVIDGKIQVSAGEAAAAAAAAAAHKVRSSSMQQAVAPSGAASAVTTVSQKHSSSDNASPSPAGTGASEPNVDGNESDSDVRRVPEMSAKGGGASGGTSAQPQGQSSGTRSRKRGGAPADKEHKRLKRLLRNRVSAQQARERKKAYLSDLEVRSKELQQRNEELEDKVLKLERENMMLRQIVKNTTAKKSGGGGAGD